MKSLAIGLLAGAAILSMAACADSNGPRRGDAGYNHVEASHDSYVDGYYDDFYGPFDVGYWGNDGVFMYRGGDKQFHRDNDGHFRRQAGGAGFHNFHNPDGHGMDHDHH